MGEITGISWTKHTFNPWIGCAKVSPACDACYAESGSKRLAAQHGLKLWDGDRYFTVDAYWKNIGKWNRAAEKAGVPALVFCASFADVFECRSELDPRRARLWDHVETAPWLTFQFLTKRPENIRQMVPSRWLASPPPNVWYGTTAENQEWLDKRAPIILDVPAVVHFLSIEPQLEPVSLRGFRPEWVIVGGESGSKARPFDVAWARKLVAECRANGYSIPFIKQLGDRPVGLGMHNGRLGHHGADPSEWPEDLRVQEFPKIHVPLHPAFPARA